MPEAAGDNQIVERLIRWCESDGDVDQVIVDSALIGFLIGKRGVVRAQISLDHFIKKYSLVLVNSTHGTVVEKIDNTAEKQLQLKELYEAAEKAAAKTVERDLREFRLHLPRSQYLA